MTRNISIVVGLLVVANLTFGIQDRPSNGVEFIPSDSKLIKTIQVDKNKVIVKYPSPSKVMEYNVMIVNGRSPVNEGHFIYNTKVHFMILVTKGSGTFFVDDDQFDTKPGDMLDVPPKTRFAVVGKGLEYVTIENPAWFPEQFYVVDQDNKIVKNE